MRVGLIINYYDVSRGGVERYADTLTRSLLAAGHRVRVMAAGAKELPEGAELVRVPELSFWSPARTWTFAKSAERLLDRERGRVDAVLGLARVPHQDVFRVGGGSHKAHLLATKPWTATRAGSALIRLSPRHAALLAMERRILEGWREGRTLRYLCNARHVRDEIIADYGVPLDRIDVLHNPVNTERFDPERWRSARGEARRSLGVPEGAYTLLFAGSGFHRKGLDAALRAMAGAPRGAWLIVAGADDPGSYRAMARQLGVAGRVVFSGLRADIERMYAAADAFLFPTRYDAFSNATLEALAMGLPAITTQRNGASEVITHGREGFVVDDPSDTAGLAQALERLADPGLRMEMGQWARRRAQTLAPAPHAEAVIKLLEAAIVMRGGRA
ncbi:MAG: hypothetical protein A2Y95_02630 [Deltaproteobacteria bacterium RBG_13_65_10]|nr:MAG: hypothetical protein A2Y95_02630 [Deltaproteobacteria bacterium RBG_13_65_10]